MGSLDFLLTGCSEPKQVTRLRELRALVAVYCGWDHPAKLALDRALAPGKSSALALEAVAEIDRLPALRRCRATAHCQWEGVAGESDLINPAVRTITETEFDGTLEDLCRQLDCSCIGIRSIDGDFFVDVYNNLFFDDEGLLDRAHPRKHCFEINAEWERLGPFPDKGLACGCHQRLNRLADVMMTLEQLRALVSFTERQLRGIDQKISSPIACPGFLCTPHTEAFVNLPIIDGSNS